MQIVELDHQRQATLHADASQRLSGGAEAAVADLLRIVADVPDVWAVAVVEAEELTQQMRVGLGLVLASIGGEQRHQGVFELALGYLHAVAVQNLEAPREQVAQHRIGFGCALRCGTRLEDEEAVWASVGPVVELV